MRTRSYTQHNSCSLIHNGQEFINTCCELVNQAQEKIFFHTYAFEQDRVTQPFIDALIDRARQGVQVFIIIDAIGSKDIKPELNKLFLENNIRFCYFAPLISKHLENVGRRLHQKLLLIDNEKALVGGINHGHHFICPDDGNAWLDYAVLLEGEEVYNLQNSVKRLYFKYFPKDADLLRSLIRKPEKTPETKQLVRTTVNDFMRFRSDIYRSHLRAIGNAERRIQIFATYFLPGKKLLKELKRAARRGVRVELIFGTQTDHITEKWSSKYLYSWYLRNNFYIHEWDKSVLHGKVTLIDDTWVSLGSYNHNHLSRYINLELNLEILDAGFASVIAEEFESVRSRSRRVTQQSWRRGTAFWQLALYLSTYMLANVITLASTIIIIRKKEHKLNE